MVCACIDIGTNTTRLLVAEPSPDGLREVLAQRVFTRVRRAQAPDGPIAPGMVLELVDVVAAQARAARAVGAQSIVAVATAAVRSAPNREELVTAVRRAAEVELEVLPAAEEARLAFCGATRTLAGPPPSGTVGVVDLGGGSTELVVGTMRDGVRWWRSVAVGSGTLIDAHVRHDPPSAGEIADMRRHAAGAFADIGPPSAELGLAVGGSATSLRRLCGGRLDPAALDGALRRLARAPAAEIAAANGLDVERVRLLPGALVVLEQAAAAFAAPLTVARGGLREGIILSSIEEEAAAGGQGT
jgi:exopolyphosphatase/guanosine-5'-triphosphate,3'-diphosphate pyrophosphatase